VSLFHRMSSFHRAAIHRFHCTVKAVEKGHSRDEPSVPNYEVSYFKGPDEVSLFHRMFSFFQAAVERFDCILCVAGLPLTGLTVHVFCVCQWVLMWSG
jgi:hypothetical protein